MTLSNKWWILCAFSLSLVGRFGSCRRHSGADEARAELFIFNELCALRDEPGPCKALKDRFFFNVDSGRCEIFEYGGCGGNDNNFETLEACEETCVVSENKNPCHLAEAPGPCRGLLTRYFFDSSSQQCRMFYYGGCFGNANNFRSMSDCQEKCQNTEQPTKTPEVHTQPAQKASVVQPTAVTGELALVEATDPQEAPKGPSRSTVHCFSPVVSGTCDGTEKRFAFNPKSRRCQAFHYSGCGGNENNFLSRKDCIKHCIRSRKVAAHGKKTIRIRKKNLNNIVNRSY